MRKYSGLFDIWMSNLDVMQHPSGVMHCLLNEHPLKSFKAMAEHSSQWVWYVCFPLNYKRVKLSVANGGCET